MSNKVVARKTNGECALVDLPDALPAQSGGALKISGSVGEGGTNLSDDVRTIQKALNQVPEEHGRPVPLLEVDGVAGKLTKGAIMKFQQRQFGWSDGRIDPDKTTLKRLSELQPGAGAGPLPARVLLVHSTLPLARQLVRSALRAVELSLDLVEGRATGFVRPLAASKFATLNVFFHIDRLSKSQQRRALERMLKVFTDMRTVIGINGPLITEGSGVIQPDPLKQPNLYAFTYFGGFTRRDKLGRPKMSRDDNYEGLNLRQDAMYFSTGLDGATPDVAAFTLVHELAHWVGPEVDQPQRIADHSYAHKSGFFNLAPEIALQTADSYSMFAVAAAGKALQDGGTVFLPPVVFQ